MSQLPRTPLTYAEYLALEQQSDLRHEFLDGEAWAMAGGSIRHAKLKTNLAVDLSVALGDGPCQAYDSDLKVRSLETGLATYPDLTVICGPVARHPEDPNAATNPAVVVEVLSPSTEAWDRGAKFRHLGQAPSLRHYVLVSQTERLVEVFSRGEGDAWVLERFGPGQHARLPGIDLEVDVDRLYRNLPDGEA